MTRRKQGNTVYSTGSAAQKRCPRCGSYPCRCPQVRSLPAEQQTAHIRRETKSRGGKTVTAIMNLQLTEADMKALAKILKKRCGVGGTVKNEIIEIQGDQRETVVATLQQLGYKTKMVGG
jgi:translation initiation factor 1